MKILHVIRGLTNSSGTTHIVGPLAEEQARLGHSVCVYYVDKPPYEPITPSPDLVRSRSFPVTVLRKHPGVSIPFAHAIDRDIRRFDIAHVHAVWNFPSFYTMRAAAAAGVSYMVAPQGSLEPWALAAGSPMRRAYARHIEGPLIRRASGMQALTQDEARQFEQFGYDGPISIIPNGVAPDWLTPERGSLARDLDLPEGAQTLLFLSRVHPKKGLDVLLRGFASFATAAPNVTLVVAGDDSGSGYLDAMKQLVMDLGISQKCRFLGEVAGTHKRRVLAGADAFALTSHSEGLPVALLEAMACALPVLITPGCNLPEVAEADAGVVIRPAGDAVAAGLCALFASDADLRRRGTNGRALIATRFTWPHIARQTLAAYTALTRSARADAAA